MKKYSNHFICLAVVSFLLAACSQDFLELRPRGTDLEANYYRNETEAFRGLIAVYDVVGWQGGGYVTKINAMNVGSDDHYTGGGGANDVTDLQVFSNYTLAPDVGPQEELWRKGYSGIFRANILLQKLPDVPMDEGRKARFTAETRFLRAYFYFDLIRLFKNIPLFAEPVSTEAMFDVLQADPASVYALLEEDLLASIPALPNTVPTATEGGRATVGAARALLGKVYLQQERFSEAAEQFSQVNGTPGGSSMYGYQLLNDFSSLWQVSNKFNSESIFEISFANNSGGDWGCIGCTEGNILNIMSGPRGYNRASTNTPDYVAGWGFFVVTADLFNVIHYDPRNAVSVANLDSLSQAGLASYEPSYMNTGYFLGKFIGRDRDRPTGAGAPELNFPQNMYEIRLADTYLLEAEALIRGGGDAGRAAALLTAVRARVGLGAVPATLENIKAERRLELVGEGHRWFDLVRWGDAPAALGSRGFVAGRHEILPIPLLELENTQMEQSREWGGTR